MLIVVDSIVDKKDILRGCCPRDLRGDGHKSCRVLTPTISVCEECFAYNNIKFKVKESED